jgi:dCTP deaminase
MSLLNDIQIRERCTNGNKMIFPYVDHQIRLLDDREQISFGESCYGYDIRLGKNFKEIKEDAGVIDIKDKNFSKCFNSRRAEEYIILPPHGFILAESVEYFQLPQDVFGLVSVKSTYARIGLGQAFTTLEPGWKGILTLELSNLINNPIKLYVGEGIMQIIFLRGEKPNKTYDENRKYQDQKGVTIAKINND